MRTISIGCPCLFEIAITMNNLPSGCITLEEHAALPSLGDEHPCYEEIYKSFPGCRQRLADLRAGRIEDMDRAHVDFQIISQVSGIANWRDSRSCRLANDELAEAIKKAPNRLGGFAALHMGDPEEASRELERAVSELGLLGAMIDNHLPDMTHYDSEIFWPVFQTAERLGVPIYLHPAPPSEQLLTNRFRGNYPELFAVGLSTGLWGWHEDEGLHVVKLFAAGLFKRFPSLNIIVGHTGELIPMMIDRIDGGPFFRNAGLGYFKDVVSKSFGIYHL